MDCSRWRDGVAEQQFVCQTWAAVILWLQVFIGGILPVLPLFKNKIKLKHAAGNF